MGVIVHMMRFQGRVPQLLVHKTPEAVMVTLDFGRPPGVPSASTLLTTSMPSMTSPKTTCLSSSHWVMTVVIKNCDPLVFWCERGVQISFVRFGMDVECDLQDLRLPWKEVQAYRAAEQSSHLRTSRRILTYHLSHYDGWSHLLATWTKWQYDSVEEAPSPGKMILLTFGITRWNVLPL